MMPRRAAAEIELGVHTMQREVARGRHAKPLIGVVGFLGRGNAGDEAILQCIYERFRDEFDVVVVVDEHGAFPGWWDWYPYNEVERIHQGNIHYFEKTLAGLIVGGGGLGLGYGGSQVLVARGAGTPVVFAGTDHTHTLPVSQNCSKAARTYLDLFDYVAFRSAKSVDVARSDGIEATYGSDWALLLTPDDSRNVEVDRRRVLIIVREYDPRLIDIDYYRTEMQRLCRELDRLGMRPVFLPFSPEDERFLTALDLSTGYEREVHWWNPRRMLQIMASSGLVISVGRLHPMIFSSVVGTPTVQMGPPTSKPLHPRHLQKLVIMAGELGVSFSGSVQETLDHVRRGVKTDLMNARVSEAKGRLSDMAKDIQRIFLKGLT